MRKQTLLVIILAVLMLFVGLLWNRQARSPERTERELGILSTPSVARYLSPTYPFSFEKPEGYTVGVVPSGEESETVVVQNIDKNPEHGFQIFITPKNDITEITPDVLAKELPEMEVRSPKKIILDEKANGILFFSDSPDFGGDSFEVWFVYGGVLYQISSYTSFSDTVSNIINTWKFE